MVLQHWGQLHRRILLEAGAKVSRQIGHCCELTGPALVDPFQKLPRAKRLFPPSHAPVGETLGGAAQQVHLSAVNRHCREEKGDFLASGFGRI